MQGEVIDASVMSCSSLRSFLTEQLSEAVEQDVLFSLHMKATMMKVSDPIIFGHCVEAYLGELLEKHGETLKNTGFNPNNGLSDFYRVLDTLDPEIQIARLSPTSRKLSKNALPSPWSIRTKELPTFTYQAM